MIRYTESQDALIFKVQVVPRASRSEIVGEHNGALRVRIAAPPVDGAANEELIRTLARAFKIRQRDIEIISGHSSKHKEVSIKNLTPSASILTDFVRAAFPRLRRFLVGMIYCSALATPYL